MVAYGIVVAVEAASAEATEAMAKRWRGSSCGGRGDRGGRGIRGGIGDRSGGGDVGKGERQQQPGWQR